MFFTLRLSQWKASMMQHWKRLLQLALQTGSRSGPKQGTMSWSQCENACFAKEAVRCELVKTKGDTSAALTLRAAGPINHVKLPHPRTRFSLNRLCGNPVCVASFLNTIYSKGSRMV